VQSKDATGAPPPLVLVVMGVSGSGKTTVARLLAARLGWDYAEADDFHSEHNKEKMAAGHPLTDADRWPWLESIADWIRQHAEAGRSGIVTCSALKRSYREVLRGQNVLFVHLVGDVELLQGRIGGRHGHFMPAALLGSQIATLEPLGADERGIRVSVATRPSDVVATIIRALPVSDAAP
jgi:carbohydrate kinase (thermoresistant glucokinase family)